MILSVTLLNAIKSGTVSLVFRRWKKPSVKKGSIITTAVGRVSIDDVSIVEEDSLTAKHAIKAGLKSKQELVDTVNQYPGDLYKITLSYHSEDPRIDLRQQRLTDELFLQLQKKLDRMDKSSKEGPWTMSVLKAINDHPLLRAADLCKKVGMEKMAMKLNIRKLKNLGLTISHEVGYEISPLGKEFLGKL